MKHRFETAHEEAHNHGKGSEFGRGAYIHYDRGWRPVVYIRNPHVKRYRTKLECQTDHHENEPEYEDQVIGTQIRNRCLDLLQIQRTGYTVDH